MGILPKKRRSNISGFSLTRLCLEGFLLNFLLVSGGGAPGWVPPSGVGGFPRPVEPGSPSSWTPGSPGIAIFEKIALAALRRPRVQKLPTLILILILLLILILVFILAFISILILTTNSLALLVAYLLAY